jgi:hypothetical protein
MNLWGGSVTKYSTLTPKWFSVVTTVLVGSYLGSEWLF